MGPSRPRSVQPLAQATEVVGIGRRFKLPAEGFEIPQIAGMRAIRDASQIGHTVFHRRAR